MKRSVILLIVMLLSCSVGVYAKQARAHLSEKDIERVKIVKETVGEVEKKPLSQMIGELEKTTHPEINLAIKEAMAHAYADIVHEQNVQGQGKKEWLYSMIALNMAYFQFGGDKDSAGGTKNLNKLIRYKLKMYLPPEIFNQPGFHAALG